MTPRSTRSTRRQLLAACGAGAATLLTGCSSASRTEPTYHDGTVDESEGGERSAEQMAAARALAITDATDRASGLDSLSLERHDFVLEDGYLGSTVQGTVSNTGGERVSVAEVRVRVYGSDGAQLGQYLARTGDLAPGTTVEPVQRVTLRPRDGMPMRVSRRRGPAA